MSIEDEKKRNKDVVMVEEKYLNKIAGKRSRHSVSLLKEHQRFIYLCFFLYMYIF